MFLYSTKITDKHNEFIAKKIKEQIDSSKTIDELNQSVYDTMSKMYLNAYSPLMIRRYVSGIPDIDSVNKTVEECICDIDSVSTENMNIANNLKSHFNERQNQKNSMINQIKLMNNTIDDAMFLNDQLPSQNTVIFRDSFTTTDCVDLINTEGLAAEISTKEGVARLNVTSVENLSSKMFINKIEGIGEYGNAHMVDMKIDSSNNPDIEYSQTAGDDPSAMFDDQPNTFFEYSTVGISRRR